MGSTLAEQTVKDHFFELWSHYKPDLRSVDLPSEVYLEQIMALYRESGTLIDLGGGISVPNGVLAQLGMSVYVVDMLETYWEHRPQVQAKIAGEVKLLESCGVRFIVKDISTYDLTADFADNSVDVISSFHCMEHLHSSPRLVLQSAMRVLKPGGKLVIEVPNAANARKRLSLLFGRTNYTPYNQFFYTEPFWGHIREYTTGDLQCLAHNLGASRYQITGRNTIYGEWAMKIPSWVRQSSDMILRLFPGLCSCLVLEITKPLLAEHGSGGHAAMTASIRGD